MRSCYRIVPALLPRLRECHHVRMATVQILHRKALARSLNAQSVLQVRQLHVQRLQRGQLARMDKFRYIDGQSSNMMYSYAGQQLFVRAWTGYSISRAEFRLYLGGQYVSQ